MDWNKVKCYECKGKCNKKGYPSVMKGSAHCEANYGIISTERAGAWGRIRMMFPFRWMRGSNR